VSLPGAPAQLRNDDMILQTTMFYRGTCVRVSWGVWGGRADWLVLATWRDDGCDVVLCVVQGEEQALLASSRFLPACLPARSPVCTWSAC
jgi:hypothetical protein